MTQKQLILFDGVCNFCNGAVNFVIKRDVDETFVFAPIQSPLGQVVMRRYQLHTKPETFVLIRNDQCFMMSTAALMVAARLSGFWPLMGIFMIVPSVLRDPFYRLFGQYRYRLFGKSELCMIPDTNFAKRFVADQVNFLDE